MPYAGMLAAARFDLSRGLITPPGPPYTRITGKKFKKWRGAARFDQFVRFVWLAGMLPLPGLDDVDLAG